MKKSINPSLVVAIIFVAAALLIGPLLPLLRLVCWITAIIFIWRYLKKASFMQNFLKKWNSPKAIILLVAFTGLLSSANAQSNFEYVHTDSKGTSRLRPNLFYEISPLGVKGYSYVEFYMDGENYFGQNYLTKEIKGIFGVQVETYFANFFTDYAGIGPIITFPTKDSTTVLTFSFMPLFIDLNGNYLTNYMLVEFVFFKEFKIPLLGTWRINSFGQLNLAAEGGPAWQYGEVYLEKPIGTHLYLGAGADLFCNTEWYPDPNWGLKIGYSF